MRLIQTLLFALLTLNSVAQSRQAAKDLLLTTSTLTTTKSVSIHASILEHLETFDLIESELVQWLSPSSAKREQVQAILKKYETRRILVLSEEDRLVIMNFWREMLDYRKDLLSLQESLQANASALNQCTQECKDPADLKTLVMFQDEMTKLLLDSLSWEMVQVFLLTPEMQDYRNNYVVIEEYLNLENRQYQLPANSFNQAINPLLTVIRSENRDEPQTESSFFNTFNMRIRYINGLVKRITSNSSSYSMTSQRFTGKQVMLKGLMSHLNGLRQLPFDTRLNKYRRATLRDSLYKHIILPIVNWVGPKIRIKYKFRSKDPSLNGVVAISDEDIMGMKQQLLPADIILNRTDYFLQNKIIPGFWKHVFLHVGTQAEIKRFFENDAETTGFYLKKCEIEKLNCNDFASYLDKKYPSAMKKYNNELYKGKFPHDIIDIRGDGIQTASLFKGAHSDSVAVIRMRSPMLEKALAIEKAFAKLGLPFDFDMNYRTDDSMSCYEVVTKSWVNPQGLQSMVIEPYLTKLALLGMNPRLTFSPNDFVKKFTAELKNPARQLDFVYFMVGNPKTKEVKTFSQYTNGIDGPELFQTSYQHNSFKDFFEVN